MPLLLITLREEIIIIQQGTNVKEVIIVKGIMALELAVILHHSIIMGLTTLNLIIHILVFNSQPHFLTNRPQHFSQR